MVSAVVAKEQKEVTRKSHFISRKRLIRDDHKWKNQMAQIRSIWAQMSDNGINRIFWKWSIEFLVIYREWYSIDRNQSAPVSMLVRNPIWLKGLSYQNPHESPRWLFRAQN